MARILNLPAKIRNGKGVGGAQVVGWLPVVRSTHELAVSLANFHSMQIHDPPEHKDKPRWVDFKRVIWHESFYKLVETIETASVVGRWVNCGDGVARHIYPLILILAADFEEQ